MTLLIADRHGDREGAADIRRALDRERAMHHLDESMRDREANTRTALGAAVFRLDPLERLENAAEMLRRDTDPRVRYREREVIHRALRRERHHAPRRRELVAIDEKIEDHLLEARLIRICWWQIRRDL